MEWLNYMTLKEEIIMIDEKNIIDLSDFGERDIKEEFAHIKDSIMALEKPENEDIGDLTPTRGGGSRSPQRDIGDAKQWQG